MMENNQIERDDDEEEQAIARFPVWISTIRDYFKILIPILLVLRILLDFQDLVFPPSTRMIGEIVRTTRLVVYRVANWRFRSGSGYQSAGSDPVPVFEHQFRFRFRVPSGYFRV